MSVNLQKVKKDFNTENQKTEIIKLTEHLPEEKLTIQKCKQAQDVSNDEPVIIVSDSIHNQSNRKTGNIKIILSVIAALIIIANIVLLILFITGSDNSAANSNSMSAAESNTTDYSQMEINEKNSILRTTDNKYTDSLFDSYETAEPNKSSGFPEQTLVKYLQSVYTTQLSDSSDTENGFSFCDIDSDGKNELIVKITNGNTYNNGIKIYKINNTENVSVIANLSADSVFYANGCVKSPFIENNMDSYPIWPYSVYKYNESSHKYEEIYQVSSWSKDNPDAAIGKGKKFPQDADVSSTGIVYYVNQNNTSQDDVSPYDFKDFETWYRSWNQSSPKLEIKYEPFTEDNIKKYTDNAAQTVIKETTAQTTVKESEPVITPQRSYPDTSDGYGVVTTSGDELFVRSSPEIIDSPGKGNKIDCFRDGTYLTIHYSEIKGNDKWLYVSGPALSGNYVTGYVYRDFVKEECHAQNNYSLYPNLKGVILSNGLKVDGYQTAYVFDGEEKYAVWSTRENCVIIAKETVNSYNIQWYECWNENDGSYCGWIDGDFIDFY